jgi:hypothetical protein
MTPQLVKAKYIEMPIVMTEATYLLLRIDAPDAGDSAAEVS